MDAVDGRFMFGPTIRDLLDHALDAVKEGKAVEFLEAYREETPHADANLGYCIGYLEPPELRRKMYAAFELAHPVFGTQV